MLMAFAVLNPRFASFLISVVALVLLWRTR